MSSPVVSDGARVSSACWRQVGLQRQLNQGTRSDAYASIKEEMRAALGIGYIRTDSRGAAAVIDRDACLISPVPVENGWMTEAPAVARVDHPTWLFKLTENAQSVISIARFRVRCSQPEEVLTSIVLRHNVLVPQVSAHSPYGMRIESAVLLSSAGRVFES
jgi:hypothetical protein